MFKELKETMLKEIKKNITMKQQIEIFNKDIGITQGEPNENSGFEYNNGNNKYIIGGSTTDLRQKGKESVNLRSINRNYSVGSTQRKNMEKKLTEPQKSGRQCQVQHMCNVGPRITGEKEKARKYK